MNLFELFVKIGVKDEASGTISKITGGLGKGLATAAKIGTAAVGAAAAGITALTKQSVQSYAEFEQLVGGAELMFGDAFNTVIENSQNAYKTVQMSQNEYLQQVNGFATGLKTALGGNEQAAAELADRIITAEADIIAATGNTAENVQNAFNGIMRSNFTMLDNLQIGITPTKEGFQEVIDKVNEWNKANGEATEYQMGNLADMQSALVDYIEMQGYSGYASREAANTISGSVASMKSAWTNLVTGFAGGSADIGSLIDNLVTTIVGDGTESNLGVIGNVLPAVERALSGIGQLIEGAIPVLIDRLPGLLQQILPVLLSSATSLVNSVVEVLPELVDLIVDTLIDNAPMLIVASVELILALAGGLIEAVPKLLQAIPTIIKETVDGFKNSENIKKFLQVGKDFVTTVGDGLKSMLSSAATWGKDMIENFIGGIKEKWNKLKDTVANVAQSVKDFLGFSEPKKGPLSNFHTYAPDMMDLFAKGIRDNEDVITDQIEKSFDFGERTMKFGAEYGGGHGAVEAGGAFGDTIFNGDIIINVNGDKYRDENALVEAVAVKLQRMTDRRAAVFANG